MSKNKPERASWREASTFFGGPGRKWTGWAAPILLVALIGFAAIILFVPRPETTPATSTPVATGNAPDKPTETADEAGQASCPASPVNADATAPPNDLEWVSVYGNSWPVSDELGPRKVGSVIGECFDRSPIGAALAAVNTMQAIRLAETDTAMQILDTRFLQNAGVDVAREGIAETYATSAPQDRPWGRVMGYKVLSFTADAAEVLLIEDWPQRGQYTGAAVTVLWSQGDWKVQLDESGRTAPNADITVDPDSFTRWVATS
jgi:hypothetical protein